MIHQVGFAPFYPLFTLRFLDFFKSIFIDLIIFKYLDFLHNLIKSVLR